MGRRLRLRDLYVLSTVVQAGSMAKARLYSAFSQPVVSEAVADLEAAIGKGFSIEAGAVFLQPHTDRRSCVGVRSPSMNCARAFGTSRFLPIRP